VTDQNSAVTVRDYWGVIWLRRRWVIAIILCTLVALGRALMQPNAYVATAKLTHAPPADVGSAAAGHTGDLGRLSCEVQNVVDTVGSPAARQNASTLLSVADCAFPYSVLATSVAPANGVASGMTVADVVAVTARAGSAGASARVGRDAVTITAAGAAKASTSGQHGLSILTSGAVPQYPGELVALERT
jgi:hypothetical protein